jgi:ubiquinone/menaquinone biosynthesis C-methylase UbiE
MGQPYPFGSAVAEVGLAQDRTLFSLGAGRQSIASSGHGSRATQIDHLPVCGLAAAMSASTITCDWPPPRDVVIEAFNARAATYDLSAMHRWLAQRTVTEIDLRLGMHVLDVGAGTGLAIREIAARLNGQGKFFAVDIADTLLAVATEASRAQGIELHTQAADMCDLPYDARSFDVVICVAALAYAGEPVTALREWRRVLRPGGQLVFQVFMLDTLTAPRILRHAAASLGLSIPDPNAALGSEQRCRAALAEAGMTCLSVTKDSWVDDLPEAEVCWDTIRRSVMRYVFDALTPSVLATLKERFCSGFEAARAPSGGNERQSVLFVRATPDLATQP